MAYVDVSAADPPRPRGRRCSCCACACCKIVKAFLCAAAVVVLLIMAVLGHVLVNVQERLAVESLAYVVVACLYICTSSGWKEKIVSGLFVVIFAAAVVAACLAATAESGAAEVIFRGNLVALSLYCIWQYCLPLLACLRWRCSRALEPAAAAPAARPAVQVQQEIAAPRIEGLPHEYSYREVQDMTRDFRRAVGRGYSAVVFRGVLTDDTAVAVKRIRNNQSVGVGDNDFLREIATVSSVHHYALVKLLGYCLVPGGDRHLVYPFFENLSLDTWIFADEERRRQLPWPTRRRIAVDAARALVCLHHECRQQILHLDFKPANILLDREFRAHVSDFGVSVSAGGTTGAGTRGRSAMWYMAPEMVANVASAKSDVYSYGMTLLELVGGRRNFELATNGASSTAADFTRNFFPCVVRDRMVEGRLMEVIDATIASHDAVGVEIEEVSGDVEEEVSTVVKVALCCIQHSPEMRPNMTTVVDMLVGRAAVLLPPESRIFAVNLLEPLPSPVAGGWGL